MQLFICFNIKHFGVQNFASIFITENHLATFKGLMGWHVRLYSYSASFAYFYIMGYA